jgi:hypothetical protein
MMKIGASFNSGADGQGKVYRGGGAERSKGNGPSQEEGEEGEEGAAQCRQRSFLTMVL